VSGVEDHVQSFSYRRWIVAVRHGDGKAATESQLNGYLEALTELAPNTCPYINEADPFETNYHEVFWGASYPRLLSIKKVADPHDVSGAVFVLVMWLAGGWGSAVPGLREVSFR
jgi:hypothetical protein